MTGTIIVLEVVSKDDFMLGGRRSALDMSMFIFRGRRSTLDAWFCVFFANHIGRDNADCVAGVEHRE